VGRTEDRRRDGTIARREFCRRSAAGLAAAAAGALSAKSYARVMGSADRIQLAVIGPGHRGRTLLRELFALEPRPNFRIAALCDIWKVARESAKEEVTRLAGEAPAVFHNVDQLYGHRDVDAVIITTPDHQHAKMCVQAVKNKKDVYVEKPLAHFLDDALEVVRVVRDSGRVVQVGTQRRSSPRYRAAAEFAQSGRFGEVLGVELSWNVNDSRKWRREEEVARLKEEDTDWNRFRMHLPADSFDPRKELEFRLFWPYSSGIPDQWMSHLIDVVPLITGDPLPRSCVANGGIYAFRDGRRNPDTFTAVFEYPRGFQVIFRSRMHNSDGGVSQVYYSRWGKLDLEAGVATGAGGGDEADPQARKITETVRLPETGGLGSHLRNFLDCLRTRQTPNSDIDSGFQHSVALCMAIEAFHSGKRVGYDPRKDKLF